MWTICVSSLARRQRLVAGLSPVIVALLIAALTGLRGAEAEAPVKFLSEKVEGKLVIAQAGDRYHTEIPVDIIVQNDGDALVQISFCLMPEGESECPGQDFTAAIGGGATLLPDGSFQLEKGRIKDLKLDLTLPKEQTTPPPPVQTPTPAAATPAVKGPGAPLSQIQTALQSSVESASQFIANEQPKSQTGLLILRVNGRDADAIPYTLTPQKAPDSFIDALTTRDVVWWGFWLTGGMLIWVLFFVLAIPWLDKYMPGDPKYRLPLRALMQLPMGVAEWKLTDSWLVNLSLAIAILGGIEGLLPDSLKSFKTAYGGLIFLFGVLTAFAAFAYNATTRPGPEKEADTQTYKKQGRAGAYLTASFLVIWALMGQLGMQLMAVERIRDISDLEIPGLFLIAFEFLLLWLILRVALTTPRTLLETILDQKIEAHKKAYGQSKVYRDRVIEIKKCALRWYRWMQSRRVLTQETLAQIKREFVALVPPEGRGVQSTDEKQLYGYFRELFHINLPVLLDSAAQDQEATRNFLRAIADDAAEAEKLLWQTLPVEDAVAAFYSSLWTPREVRQTNYTKTLEQTARHLRVACAQASSPVEPDRVIGPNEELYTNLLATLDELDKALGLAGKKDPFYANLKKLCENAKLKWEVMKISQLETHLCSLADSLEACKKKLETFFNDKAQKSEIGEARLAMTLEPFAVALGEPVPYPKTFPVDTEALDEAYKKRPSIEKAREKMAAPKPKAVPRKAKSRTVTPEATEPSRASTARERKNLQASLLAIASNPEEITPYPATDREYQQNRSKALHHISQKKVLGEDVTLL